jgi:isoleucyl-tRNA synthetase
LGPKVKFFGKALAGLDASDAAVRLENGETITLDLDGEPYEINKENVLITITAKEGFNVATENNLFVILDTTLDPGADR